MLSFTFIAADRSRRLTDDNRSRTRDNLCRRERKYKVAIKHVTMISLQQLKMLMAGFTADIPGQALQVLDTVLRDIVLNERNEMG